VTFTHLFATRNLTVTVDTMGETGARRAEGREFVAIVTALMALTAVAVDLMIPTFPDMRREFGMAADSARIGWVVTAFFLGLALGPWLYGPASDRYGRRRPLVAGLCLYTLGAIVSALAPSFAWLIVARFIWGLGAAGSRTLSLAMIRDRYEGESMARLMSMIMAVFLLVPVVAPSLGAGLNAIAPWRIVFWLPAGVAGLLLVWSRRLPETHGPERRRPFTWSALRAATRVVFTNRQSVCFTAAITLMMGVMTGYLASSELILDGVYDRASIFPFFFGANAIVFSLGSVASARLVGRLGIAGLVRRLAVGAVGTSVLLSAIALATHGRPNFWLFAVSLALVLPLIQAMIPNCNTGAMLPVAQVAGTAAAVIATITTAGGALLGNALGAGFDGTTRPFSLGATTLLVLAAVLIWLATGGRRPAVEGFGRAEAVTKAVLIDHVG